MKNDFSFFGVAVLILLTIFLFISLLDKQMDMERLKADLKDRDTAIAQLQKRPDLPESLNNSDILNNEAVEFIDFPGNYSVIWKPHSAKEISEGRADHTPGFYKSVHYNRKVEEIGYLMYIKYSINSSGAK
ncbi:MAG: hypothetical protein UV40_C0024G0012 [Parcubacteria group bacterium GW2011_GWA1_42_7]|nr:MAG: hypothetical protein UV34_C0025G0013 [Parcubacteria group bacterium GW2011_GWB1_42_6]KKS69410.1 MAG: hypothetical protein UV40_C0024G0012 [Parcubacteria group bacterium GW2011_GWA1_42_7]KKS91989.1 MAG: hypothetical protein UV67_C0013G0014 [Parcubacteria group bacterium GW2011_GWC1_43_12]